MWLVLSNCSHCKNAFNLHADHRIVIYQMENDLQSLFHIWRFEQILLSVSSYEIVSMSLSLTLSCSIPLFFYWFRSSSGFRSFVRSVVRFIAICLIKFHCKIKYELWFSSCCHCFYIVPLVEVFLKFFQWPYILIFENPKIGFSFWLKCKLSPCQY